MTEKVSCLLATRNRPGFFRIALECFLRQDHPNAELIVIDDGEEQVGHLCQGLAQVHYIGLNQPTLLGTKLNLGAATSSGTILQKLDDDDYYQPNFLSTATQALQENAIMQDNAVVAWDCFYILMAGETGLRASGHGWKAGGTLCFAKKLWQSVPFRDVPKSVDSFFLRDANRQVIPVCKPDQYILVRHGRNTWNLMQGGSTADAFLRTLKPAPQTLESLVHNEALAFYKQLQFNLVAEPK